MAKTTVDRALQERLHRYVKVEKVVSQSEFARIIGEKGSSKISQYLMDKYPAPHKIEPKIREYFQNIDEAERRQNAIPSENLNFRDKSLYLHTSISESIYNIIRSCHVNGDMAVVKGDPGIGKTKAAEKYTRDYATAIYVTANACTSSVISMMKALCRKLGLPTGRKEDMWFSVLDNLSGEPKVLIIDESQHLPFVTVDNIRQLRDAVPNLGIVFIGNHRSVKSKIKQEFEDTRTFGSRVLMPRNYKFSAFTKDDIVKFFPALQGKEKELNFMLLMARDYGIRDTINLYSESLQNENISFDGLVAMAKYLKEQQNYF